MLCIAANKAKDHLKSAHFRRTHLEEPSEFWQQEDAATNPVLLLEHAAELDEMLRRLRGLNPAYEKVLLLYSVYGYTAEEIAEYLMCPVGTVHTRLYRARRQLKRIKLKNTNSSNCY